jgi:ABC-type Fe3+-hydroxamate transport system substrate-binding protein
MPRDDMGHPVDLVGPARRIVSLVPSLTESLATTGTLVGVTDWCAHPADLDVARIRGTKNPDRAAILSIEPDLVVANKEENRELDVRRLREAGIPVWVTDIETVPGAIHSIRRLFVEALQLEAPPWLEEADRLWAGPVTVKRTRVAIPIWRDPWMVVGRRTFTSDLAERVGLTNVFGVTDGASRYPAVGLAQIDREDVDLVLLPDEPYAFSASDGPEAFTCVPTTLVSGRLLTWYGPSLLEAHAHLAGIRPPGG